VAAVTVRSAGIYIVALVLAFALQVSSAFAGQSTRTATSLALERSTQAMKAITRVPYSTDQQGNLVGRSEEAERQWFLLAGEINRVVTAANPMDVDDEAIGEIADQFLDPIGWGGYPLAGALGRVGSRGVLALVERIRGSTDPIVQYRLTEGLVAVAAKLGSSDLSSQAIGGVTDLLDSPNHGVVVNAVQALEQIGPPARAALPALERTLQAARSEEMTGGVRLGPQMSYLVQMAIAQISGRTPP